MIYVDGGFMKLKIIVLSLFIMLAGNLCLGEPPSFLVSGVTKSGDEFQAYIAGEIVTVGQEVAGCPVVAIDDNGVTVKYPKDDKLYYYAYGQDQGILMDENSRQVIHAEPLPAVTVVSTLPAAATSEVSGPGYGTAEGVVFIVYILINLAVSLLMLVSMWRVLPPGGRTWVGLSDSDL